MLGASLRAGSPVFWLSGAGGATPAPAPPPAITNIVVEGDSITSTAPLQTGLHSDFYSHVFADANSSLTTHVTAQASRTVGGAAGNGDLQDDGSPSGNTLLAHRSDDLAYAPQLLSVMIGTNDFGTQSLASYKARLIAWAGPVRAAGTKILYSPPPPLSTAGVAPNYAAAKAKRDALMTDVRDPAVWGQWADYYNPMGEHADFNAADNSALYSASDGVHPTGPVEADSGQARLSAVFSAVMATLLDASRAASTRMDDAAWPASETALAPATQITRRFIVKGIAPSGLALTGGNALSVAGADAQLRRAGGAWGTSLPGWLYNGDVVDLRLTTSAGNSTATAVDLRVGDETRTLTYTTVANVTPVGYAYGDVEYFEPGATSLSFTRTFAAGVAVIGVNGNFAAGVSVGGAPLTRRVHQVSNGTLEMWTGPVAAGQQAVAISFAGATGSVAVSWGAVMGADATPVQVDQGSPGAQASPHPTGGLTVPANGLALAMLAEYAGGASAPPARVLAGSAFVDEGQGSYQGAVLGLCVATRATGGAVSFGFGSFNDLSRGALVFKAAGT